MPHNYINIDIDRCKGCELCVQACPQDIITMAKDNLNKRGVPPAQLDDPDHNCTACRLCYQVCPDLCITVYKDEEQEEITDV